MDRRVNSAPRARIRRVAEKGNSYSLTPEGIEFRSTNWKGVAEEAAAAYEDVDEVVRVSHELGIGRLVAKVAPIGVMKG